MGAAILDLVLFLFLLLIIPQFLRSFRGSCLFESNIHSARLRYAIAREPVRR